MATILRLILFAFFWASCLTVEAMACSMAEQQTFFDFQSAEIRSGQQAEVLKAFGLSSIASRADRRVDERCEHLVVKGYADGEESRISNEHMDVARAKAVRDFLVREANITGSRIEMRPMGNKLYDGFGSGVRDPMNRVAVSFWENAEGRWRCDPASKSSVPMLCGGEYLACYLELADGTVCNFDNVPDPNSGKYSIDYYGAKLD